MTEFDTRLGECLQALSEGRWDLEECLRRYPEDAAELRPLLLAATAYATAHHAEPRAEFAERARERFLIATGQRISETYDIEPSPSFFAATRVKFLMAAQKLRASQPASAQDRAPGRGWLPSLSTPLFRGFAAAGVTAVIALGFSAYTVSSSSAALPGDWDYGVKLQTERVRLALAFSDDAKQDVRIDIAGERANELERLASKGRIIGPGVLDRMASQTAPLVEAVDKGELDAGDLKKFASVVEKQKSVLAMAEGQVAPNAQAQLEQAKDVSATGVEKVVVALRNSQPDVPFVITPVVLLTETPRAESTATPTPTATSTESPDASPTSEPDPATTPEPAPTGVVITPVDDDVSFGVAWTRITVGRLSVLIPSDASGWQLSGDLTSAKPSIIRLTNADGTSIITINARNGDIYWFTVKNGVFDEVQLRGQRDGQTFVADQDIVRLLYGSASDIPLYILRNLDIAPEPEPTPEPTKGPPAE